jgi:hypothetical protein
MGGCQGENGRKEKAPFREPSRIWHAAPHIVSVFSGPFLSDGAWAPYGGVALCFAGRALLPHPQPRELPSDPGRRSTFPLRS